MKARKFGRIVNFASIAARRGSDRVGVHYAAAKGGIIGLTKTLALELGPHNITVNAIAPGFIKTEMVASMKPEILEKMASGIPLQRLGEPHEIAATAAFIFENDYVNGRVLDIDGGQRL
jgi:3-oxoacyl-[acyl-carrier protein] reductase